MSYYKGRVIAVHQCGGCREVVVEGEYPGAFPIDNCCVWSIVDAEGADWIGRRVEYRDGCMRFLDRACADLSEQHFSKHTPFPQAASSHLHVRSQSESH